MKTLTIENGFVALNEEELTAVEGGIGPAVVAIPAGVKIAGYVVGGLTAAGIAAWGYFSSR
ncbi:MULTISPECIES: class IIb bacteriocin, lactobin A/cerein 7B family [Streptococcus]|uniref:Class IIb bacteriocin, lactobin A/cerein 7B family n=1 Tax=Streptococcus ruminantium TaxID=1917441 RepID=A0A2Z5U223_9STRE|nr:MULTISPECIES: class IIb bacteriocin, lactobin A/cerein 7B family [Streptococcus]MDQ8766343.1 class IIb bacteriocin, lactobin A/cerein 7B family [Streptococcus ruminantium]MDQ8779388.1 class IIb bacteriocin, lactobin A/cerein 7B family [Streptococcus ruminantium]MDQ8821367.1 class IIb bacteriocin, lactobin A/cerein 7B family [Streptococcus ruminantium]MDQ8836280.1 class IIb bacteriocin, lactobin A/cerein 7B family [Streptococcus ruminantium]QHF53925.1 bacteriocin [Streptococcus sp. DAT741]